MIVPVMAISNLVLTQQMYSEETNGAHAHYREPVPLTHALLELYKEAPPQGSTPYPFIYHFSQKRYRFRVPCNDK